MSSQLAHVRNFYDRMGGPVGEVEKSNAVVTVRAAKSELENGVSSRNDEPRSKVAAATVENDPEVPIENSAQNNCRERVVGAAEVLENLPERGLTNHLDPLESATWDESRADDDRVARGGSSVARHKLP